MSQTNHNNPLVSRQDSLIDPFILVEPGCQPDSQSSFSSMQTNLAMGNATQQGGYPADYSYFQGPAWNASANAEFEPAVPHHLHSDVIAWQQMTQLPTYQVHDPQMPLYHYQDFPQQYRQSATLPHTPVQNTAHAPQVIPHIYAYSPQPTLQTHSGAFLHQSRQQGNATMLAGRLPFKASITPYIPESYFCQPHQIQTHSTGLARRIIDPFSSYASSQTVSAEQRPAQLMSAEILSPSFSPITPRTSPVKTPHSESPNQPRLLQNNLQLQKQPHGLCASTSSTAKHYQVHGRKHVKPKSILSRSQKPSIDQFQTVPLLLSTMQAKTVPTPPIMFSDRSVRTLAVNSLARTVTKLLDVSPARLPESVTCTESAFFCCRMFPHTFIEELGPLPGLYRAFAIKEFLAWSSTVSTVVMPASVDEKGRGRRPVKWAPFVLQLWSGDTLKNNYIPQPINTHSSHLSPKRPDNANRLSFQTVNSVVVKDELLGSVTEAVWKLRCTNAACCAKHEQQPVFTVKMISAVYSFEAEDIPDHTRRGTIRRMREQLGHVHKTQELLLALDIMGGHVDAAVEFVRGMNA